MFNRSGSILTRGRSSTFFTTGVTPFSSGFVLQITETPYIPPTVSIEGGGRSGNEQAAQEEQTKRLKRITVSVYINNVEYSESHIVDDDVKIEISDVEIEWNEAEKPTITIRGL